MTDREAIVTDKPSLKISPDDPRLGFHADANPIRSETVPNDYGLQLLRKLAGPGPITGLIAGDQPQDK